MQMIDSYKKHTTIVLSYTLKFAFVFFRPIYLEPLQQYWLLYFSKHHLNYTTVNFLKVFK